ncbi:MAG: hypothetical protein GX356_04520, partial [Corynebacterium pollutisoli]|nr:hypothetical protein [Corynebacterium pollutisoli]
MTTTLDSRPVADEAPAPRRRQAGAGLAIKLLIMAAINAFGFYGIAAS